MYIDGKYAILTQKRAIEILDYPEWIIFEATTRVRDLFVRQRGEELWNSRSPSIAWYWYGPPVPIAQSGQGCRCDDRPTPWYYQVDVLAWRWVTSRANVTVVSSAYTIPAGSHPTGPRLDFLREQWQSRGRGQ